MSSHDDMAALLASLEEEQPMTAMNMNLDDAVAAAEAEVRRRQLRRAFGAALGVSAIAIAGVLLMLLGSRSGFWIYVTGMAGLVIASLTVLVLLTVYVLRDSRRREIYKRLGPGRLLHGVCLGIAEKTKIDVTIIRMLFLALLLIGGGSGIALYIALDVAMPVHPDDRHHLLRFRVRRWWRRIRHAGAS